MTDTPHDSGQHADWNRVGAAFTALGDRIQAHFSQLTSGATAGATASADSSAPFEELGRQLDAALTSFRNAVSDPDIADAAKGAADQLIDALRTEVDSASGAVSEHLGDKEHKELPPSDDEGSAATR